ncbi:hypothetical protein BJ165DRAFT_1528735 [Panaeolus papilionaceus]|nr:hypothetical protein BJ165DRAFT_1528735 [Panaeolus papilionaceus]
MAPTAYRLKSEQTLFYPVTDGEVSGGIVNTQNGANAVPPDSILTFSDAVQDKNIIVTIAGTDGLFVALPDGATESTKLIWSPTPFQWEVVPTIQSDKTTTYQFIPASGANLYVFDEFGIGPVLVVKPGDKIVAPESYFTITPA